MTSASQQGKPSHQHSCRPADSCQVSPEWRSLCICVDSNKIRTRVLAQSPAPKQQHLVLWSGFELGAVLQPLFLPAARPAKPWERSGSSGVSSASPLGPSTASNGQPKPWEQPQGAHTVLACRAGPSATHRSTAHGGRPAGHQQLGVVAAMCSVCISVLYVTGFCT